ncbi:FimV/HubP family polar landmark protein [Aquitalea magnusonii]|uniref:Pilus assembly protein FimV n=2 Tax=Aquitalea magnusonii TaxID=332411 RepID=A0A318J919_9NEIS|nr:FimV/HubP family polar landmark protein [Aquitalea magnusonii]PXX45633.1 pilus assembly protein FimV [Aquitalea magnusonii]
MNNQAKFKLSVLAVAVVCSANVWAGLGRINVRSFLGETFHADIELTGVRSNELEGARVGLASPDTFRDLNVDYASTMSALRFQLAPSAHGAIVRVSSAVPINDPYLRFVVEAKTSSGRSVREYTVLLDPASYNAPPSKSIVQDVPQYADENLSSRYQGKTGKASRNAGRGVLQTRAGSTLRGMAAKAVPPGATLEQTMAALVQANPHAFSDGNPNTLKSGVTLKIPPAAKIKSLSAARVNAILHPDGAAAEAKSPAHGQGEDVLKVLPPDAPASQSSAKLSVLEQQVSAREQSLKDAEARISALEQQLKAMQSGKPQASQPQAEPLAAASSPATAAPPQPASMPLAEAAPAAKPAVVHKPLAPPPPPPPPEPSLLDRLIDNLPLVGGGVAGVGLLGLLGALIARRRKAGTATSLQLSTQTNNAVLGRNAVGSGPHTVSGGHSFMTNFTQASGDIDAAEVDPVAEAEVYMAYGRDAQAEEILKDALAKDPSRQEVRQKLLELYAARPDAANFEKLAREFHATTDGKGQAWARVAAMGLGIDPTNALYQLPEDAAPVESPAAVDDGIIDLDRELFGDLQAEPAQAPATLEPEPAADPLRAALFEEEAPAAEPALAEANMLDFDLDAELAAAPLAEPVATPSPAEPAAAESNLLDFDFNLDGLAAEMAADNHGQPETGTLELPASAASTDGFESLYEDMVAATPAAAPAASAAAVAAPAAEPAPVVAEGMTLLDDPLSTKLDLAKVYLDMGDRDGAREVLQDLVGEAHGSLKEEAQALLTKISS